MQVETIWESRKSRKIGERWNWCASKVPRLRTYTSKQNTFFKEGKHTRQGKLNSVKPNTWREKRKDKHAKKIVTDRWKYFLTFNTVETFGKYLLKIRPTYLSMIKLVKNFCEEDEKPKTNKKKAMLDDEKTSILRPLPIGIGHIIPTMP